MLIDGRSIYAPAFSGVFWDAEGIALEDIERIEVIRGPGATLWGANAVNGVINIITKHTDQTRGVYPGRRAPAPRSGCWAPHASAATWANQATTG